MLSARSHVRTRALQDQCPPSCLAPPESSSLASHQQFHIQIFTRKESKVCHGTRSRWSGHAGCLRAAWRGREIRVGIRADEGRRWTGGVARTVLRGGAYCVAVTSAPAARCQCEARGTEG